MPFPTDIDLLNPGDNVLRLFGSAQFQLLQPVAVGDLNEDGKPDIVLGAPGDSTNGPAAGAAYVVFGSPVVGPGSYSISEYPGHKVIIAGTPFTGLGGSAAVGDVTGDGTADLLIGAPTYDASGPVANAGKIEVFAGPLTSDSIGETPFESFLGESENDYLGQRSPLIFSQELYLPVPGADNSNGSDAGTIYGLPLPLSSQDSGLEAASLRILGAGTADSFGYGTIGISDSSLHSTQLAIGAPGFDPYRNQPTDCAQPGSSPTGVRCNGGATYLFALPLVGTIDLANAGGSDSIIYGRTSGDLLFPSGAGDLNGDGVDDLLLAESLGSGPGGASDQAGETDVLSGDVLRRPSVRLTSSSATIDLASNPQFLTVLGRDASDQLTCCTVARVNGDGLPDIVGWSAGGDGPSNDRALAGEMYVILAHPLGDVNCNALLEAGDSVAILAHVLASTLAAATSCPADLPPFSGPLIITVPSVLTV